MPYIGLNLYFIQVDRTIPVDELTGTAWQQFRQRFALTIGTTLTAPGLNGRTVNKPLGVGNYPLVAIGVRMTPYVRAAGGVVVYDLADKNPASAGHSLRPAPFVALSLDADIVKLFTDKL
jgi:hypothetical protein